MNRQSKSVISVLLCFILIFGQLIPITASTESNIPVGQTLETSVTGDVYKDSEDTQEVKFAPEDITDPVISGEISLPDGYTAPSGGISINIYASNGTLTHKTAVNIPEGETKASYSLNAKAQSGYVIYYQTSNAKYMNTMYLGAKSMVRNKASAALFDLSDGDKNLNLTIIPLRKISGKLIFPGNTDTLNFRVYAVSDLDSKSSDIIVMNGNEAEYSILVPPNTSGSGYTVRYEAVSNNTVISPGYYSTSGTERVGNYATLVDVSSNDKTDLNIEIKKKKIISGKLEIPEGATIPDANLSVTVNAVFGSDSANTVVVLSKENPIQEYKLYVPEGTGYKVGYQLNNVEQFMQKGYYSENGTVSDISKASTVNVSENDKNDINLKLIAKSSVTGIIRLPDGLKAPAEGVDVTVRVANSVNNGYTNVKIKQGTDFEYFTVYVPEGIGYKLYYETKDKNYVQSAYYNVSNMVTTASSATTFDLGSDEIKTINLSMIAKRTISGKIQLPKGVSQEQEVIFKVTASGTYGTDTTEVKMLKDESSVNYSLLVPPGDNYIVKCEITKGAITYMKTSYYSEAGTVTNSAFAKGINTIAGNQPDIDFVLVEKRKVSGTISLPENMEMLWDTTFWYTDKDDGRTYSVVFKKGSRTADYTFYMNPGIHTFYYELGDNDTFVEKGFYSETGTVMDESAATPIDVRTGDASGINFQFILKKIISGKLKLEKDTRAVGNITALVKVKGRRGEDSQNVTITNGSNYAEFKLAVPPGADYKLWYENVTGSPNVVSKMFYNSGFMTRNENEAGLIDVSEISINDIVLTLSEMKLISGELRIPDGDTLTANTSVRIYVENIANQKDVTYVDVTIPANNKSVPYNIYVPTGYSYNIRYGFLNENSFYVKDGYLGNNGMEINKSAAKVLEVSSESTESYDQVNLTLIKKRVIKGKVSLPAGISITSNISLSVFAGNYSTPVTILTDGKAVEYTLRVPPNAQDAGYKVYYKISTSNTVFNEIGYYSSSGMVSAEKDGDIIDVSSKDIEGLDITLIPKSSISGSVKLPSENLAARETSVRVYVSNNTYSKYQDVIIKEGTNSAPYIIYVPQGTGYVVRYEISNSAYVKNGYYSETGTVKEQALATAISIESQSRSGIDLTLIGNSKIEGTLKLPGTRKAPENGLKVRVFATRGNTTVTYVDVTVPQNYTSVKYSMYVSPDTDYRISYQITSDKSYMPEGFYNSTATSLDKNNATLIDATTSVTDIDMTLLSKIAISGVISIPPASDPKADLKLKIYAVNGNNTGDTDILIPKDTKQVPYTVYVPALGDYEVRYEISSNNMYVTPGYYNNKATTSEKAAAVLVKVSGDVSGIDMTIIPKRSISGTVFLKNEFAPLRGLSLKVVVNYKKISDPTKKLSDSVDVVIPEGSNSAPYTVYVSEGTDYVVSYTVSDIKHITPGYYTRTETTRYAEKAEIVDLTSGSSVGINLTLIRKKEISGTVSLTKGTAPYGGLNINLYADNGKDSGTTNIVIPAGISSVPYTIYVAEGENYKVRYNFNSSNEMFLYPAYYNSEGSKRDVAEAEMLDLTGENKTGVNINIIPMYLISGTINLPEGTVAPTGGVEVKVNAKSSRDSIIKSYTISEKNNGVDYKLFVPAGYSYKIGYTISNTNYLSGYYNLGGTVLNESDAGTISVEESDYYGINMSIIEKKIISGKISLPDGIVPSGPVSARIYAGRNDSVTVDIPKDTREASFSIKLAPNKPLSGYIVYYTLTTSSEEFVAKGYYGLNGGLNGGIDNTVPLEKDADLVDVSSENKDNINLVVLKRRIISGNIKTPGSLKAPKGGISVDVTVEGANITKNFIIPEGQSSVPYKVYVDPNLNTSGYKIKYTVKTANTGYTTNAYFNYNKPVQNANEASLVDVSTGDKVVDLVLIGNSAISGTVELPEKAPANGLNVVVAATNGTYSASAEVYIAEGNTVVPFLLSLSPASGYKVYYTIAGNNKYAPKGYYNTSGTVLAESSATAINIQNSDKSGIKLVPILNRKISGTVSLPSGYTPSGAVSVKVIASNGTYSSDVIKNLTASASSASYEIFLPPVANYKLYYEVSNADIANKGYYSTTGTVLDSNKAYAINLSSSDYTANVTLIKNREVKGTVSVPEKAPKGGLDVKIVASNKTYTYSQSIKIAQGSNSAQYSIKVPPTSGYYVWYEVASTGDYFPKGYYKAANQNAVLTEAEAQKLDLTNADAENISFSLLNYNSISGRISLSTGKAPSGGIKFTLTARNNSNTRTLDLTIPENQSFVDYTIYVPNGNGYKLYYSMQSNNDYADKAYYNNLKTVLEESNATPFDIYANKNNVNMNIIVKRTITGKIALPGNETASKDIFVDIIASNGKYDDVKETFKISAGTNSTVYSLKLLPNEPGKEYVLKFSTSFDYGYVRSGYYKEDGFVRNLKNTKTIDVSEGDFNGADFILKRFATLSGKVKLKSGVAPAEGLKVDVLASNLVDSVSTSVTIPQGQNVADYTLFLPPNDEGDNYLIRYENWGNDSYLSEGYYSNSGTVRLESYATKLDIRNDKSNIDLVIEKKKIVSGTISLPNNETAPEGGLRITISAKNDLDIGQKVAFIPSGSNNVNYSLNVPAGADYQIYYELPIINDYVMKGYYKEGTMVYKPVDAAKLNFSTSQEEYRDINLSLIKKKTITGTIALPGGKIAEEDIVVKITAENSGNVLVNIPKGTNSVPYMIRIAPSIEGKGCKVGYEVSSEYGFVVAEYYSSNGMVRNSKLADDINANDNDVTNINLTLVEPKKIMGKVALPDGAVADKDIQIKVTGSNGIDGVSTNVIIPQGKNSADYTLELPPNDKGYEYVVKYENWGEYKYTTYGYYNSKGTTITLSEAEGVDINSIDARNKDMTLVVRRTIRGNIIVPEGTDIPKEGVILKVIAENGLEVYSSEVILSSGMKSCPYVLYVEQGASYNLRYELSADSIFMERGYYSSFGTTTLMEKAETLRVTGSELTNKDLSLIIKRSISGVITLPDNSQQANGISIIASNDSGDYSVTVNVPKGKRTADYNLYVPAGKGYIIRYELHSNSEIAPVGYYSEMTSEAVRDINDAKIIDLSQLDADNINFKMLQNRTISGKIRLLEGTAGSGGIKVVLTAVDTSGVQVLKDFFIPEGESSVDYTLSVMPLSGYKLKYNVDIQDYASFGYYNSRGTVMLPEQADTIDVSEQIAEDIVITLIDKKEIRGILSLPQGVTLSNDLTVKVKAINVKSGYIDTVETKVLKGSGSVAYVLKVTPNANSNVYKVYYEVASGSGIFDKGYYNSALTVPDDKLATLLDLTNGSVVNVNMEMIKARKISGKIMLQDGVNATGNINVNVYAEKSNYTGFRVVKSIVIPQGQNYAEYELYVPESTTAVAKVTVEARTNGMNSPSVLYSTQTNTYIPLIGNLSSNYVVGYQCDVNNLKNDGLNQSGFYKAGGTTADSTAAEILNVAGGNKNNIDLVIKQKERKIKGTFKVPENITIPQTGIDVKITAVNSRLAYTPETTIKIYPGNKTVGFELPVPTSDKYHVKYTAYINGYMESGYYSSEATKGKEEFADDVNTLNGDANNIVLEPIPGFEISGSISLPSGMKVNYESFGVTVKAENEDNEYSVFVPMTMNNSSASYKMYLPTGKNYIVSYSILPLFGEYLSLSYYKTGGAATTEINNATRLEVTAARSIGGITLISANRNISGSISLPDGTGETGYSLNVPVNEIHGGYNVGYTLEKRNDYPYQVSNGYYSNNGTVGYVGDAYIIDVYNGNASNIKIPLLAEGTIPVEGIVMDKQQVSMVEGSKLNLGVKFYPENATNKLITWFSSNTNVAKVSSDGTVTALTQGEAVIKAVSSNLIEVSCKISVSAAQKTGLSLDKDEIYIVLGDKVQLNAIFGTDIEDSAVIWSSDNSNIASVSSGSQVTGKLSGRAIITAALENDPLTKAVCVVYVINPVSSIKINEAPNVDIIVGNTKQLTAIVEPDDEMTKGVIWSSSDTRVAVVDENGLVRGIKKGTAVITAKSMYNNAIKTSCTVKVMPVPVSEIRLNVEKIEMVNKSTYTFYATALPYEAEDKTVSIVINNTSALKLISNVFEKDQGRNKIIIEAHGENAPIDVKIKVRSSQNSAIEKEVTVTIKKINVTGLNWVSKPPAKKEINVGESYSVEVTTTPSNATDRNNITWSSTDTNNSYITLTSNNNKCTITGKAATTSPITVNASVGGYSVAFQIIVKAAVTPTPGGGAGPGGLPGVATPTPTKKPTATPTRKPTATPTGKTTVTPKATSTAKGPTATPKVVVAPTNNLPASGANINDYKDVAKHWAKDSFALLLSKGIISGYPDKTLKPNAEITREEISKMIIIAAGYKASSNTSLPYKDNSKIAAWAKPFIKSAMDAGIIKGYEDNTFRPKNKLTRQEMAVLVINAFGYGVSENTNINMKDANKIPKWAKGHVAKAIELGIIKGYNDNTFRPGNTITRAEVTAMIARCISQ